MHASGQPRILIRVHGDSLTMPRESVGVPYPDTYAELVRAHVAAVHPDAQVHLYNRGRGGQSIKTLFTDYSMDQIYFGSPGGDILILQVGVVDCAPRPIPGWFKWLLGHSPGPVRKPFVSFLHHNRARLMNMGFRFRTTGPAKFTRVLGKWLARAAAEFSRVYVLNIAPTTPEMEAHSPGLSAAIVRYNGLIAETVASLGVDNVHLVDVHARIMEEDEGLERYINPEDGHHITAAGHRMYADAIAEFEHDREETR